MVPESFRSTPRQLEGFQLFDLAEAASQLEAEEWGEEPGLALFLEDTVTLLQRELELMPRACAKTGERARVFILAGRLSHIAENSEHYNRVVQHADVWVFGLPDVSLLAPPGLHPVALTVDTNMARERCVIVVSQSYGAAVFAREGGRLDESLDSPRYFEGLFTTRPQVVDAAAQRLSDWLKLTPTLRRPNLDLTMSWSARLNSRLLEMLESQKLELRGKLGELARMEDQQKRMEQLVRGYVGGHTWAEVQAAVEKGRDIVLDRRDELTVCFCDLVNFTSLSERLHPSEVAKILNDHYSKLHEIVLAHFGWIDKFIGDAMLAVFPDPIEAMSAAQKMVRESRKVRVTEAMEVPVAVRVGLNTGLVAVANLGVADHRERTVLGDAVNVAQRLQVAAQPHTVVISEDTYNHLPFPQQRGLRPLDVTVKGKTGIVKCYMWTLHSSKMATETTGLRESLLIANRRAPLIEHFRRSNKSPESE